MAEENAYCPKCGSERETEQKFCPQCGHNFSESTPGPPGHQPGIERPHQQHQNQYYRSYPVAPTRRNDGFCIAALVLGILAWVIPIAGILLAVPAIIFGSIGIKRVNRNPNYLTGTGMAIAGLVLGVVGIGIAILLISIFVPVFSAAKSSAQKKTCQSQMRTILSASDIYAAYNDGRYPTSMSQLLPDYLETEYRCPKDNSAYVIQWSENARPKITCPNHGSI